MADPLYYDFDGRPVKRPSADDYNLTEYLGGGKTARLYEVAKFCEEAYEIPKAEFDKMVKDRGSSPTEDRLDAADATKTSGKVLTSLMSAKDLDTPEKRSAYAEQLADEAVQAVQAIRLVSRVVQRTTAETGWYARIPPARAMAVLARANHARSASTRGALVVHATITPDCEPPLSCVQGPARACYKRELLATAVGATSRRPCTAWPRRTGERRRVSTRRSCRPAQRATPQRRRRPCARHWGRVEA